ncbi:hypothetical protein ACWDUI_37630, partial [Streptosporangium sandarakinum]
GRPRVLTEITHPDTCPRVVGGEGCSRRRAPGRRRSASLKRRAVPRPPNRLRAGLVNGVERFTCDF